MPGFTNTERLALYTHLRAFESDFDKSQSQMRAICAAWSGVVMGAIALLVTNAYTPPNGMSDPDLHTRAQTLAALRAAVCIIGSAGVYAFWFIDQRIYQRLLDSVFAYGLFVEFKNHDLPQIRSTMLITDLDVTEGLAWFYRMQFFVFFVLSAFFALTVGGKITLPELALLALHLLGVIFGESYFRKWPKLEQLVAQVWGTDPQSLANAIPRPGEQDNRLAAWQERVRAAPIPPQPAASARPTPAPGDVANVVQQPNQPS